MLFNEIHYKIIIIIRANFLVGNKNYLASIKAFRRKTDDLGETVRGNRH